MGPSDSIRCLEEQSTDLGSTVVGRDIRPLMTQQVPPVLEADPGCSQPPTERVPEIVNPNVSKAGWRLDPEGLSITLRGESSNPEPVGRTQLAHWCATTRRYENESTMATPNPLEDRRPVIDNDQT